MEECVLRKALVVAACALGWGIYASNAYPQISQGQILGTIRDTSGAAVPRASVMSINLQTGEKATTVSNGEGYYVISALPVGTYTVTATLKGFQTSARTPVIVSTAVTTTVDLVLQPGSVTQTVTVHAASSQVQTSTAQLSTVVQDSVAMDLPLQLSTTGTDASGRRQLDNFIFLTPGVTGTPFSKSFNGSSTFVQELVIDGGNSGASSTPGLLRGYSPPFEAVNEFNIQNTTYPAEYTRGFGVMNFSLKSGTDQLHGDAFDYFRNTVLDARPFFSSFVPITKQNEYGFTVGGPIVIPKLYNGRDKTFFFGAYTGFQLRGGAPFASYVTIPTAAMKAGDFSQLLSSGIQIYNPATTRADGAGGFTRTAFANNMIPTSMFDPSATKLLQYLPKPDFNQPFNNFLSRVANPTSDNAFSIKLDHTLSDKERVAFSYYWDWTKYDNHYPVPGPLDAGWQVHLPGGGFRLNHYYTFSPDLLNTVTVGYTNNTLIRSLYTNIVGNSVLGIPNLQSVPGFPCMNITGIASLGDGCEGPLVGVNRDFQIRDTVSWTKGKHQIKFGTDLRRGTLTQDVPCGSAGTYGFSNLETSLPDSKLAGKLGYGFASFLLGQVDSAQQTIGTAVLGIHVNFYSAFAEDDFRISPKLTVNMGLAFDYPTPFTEEHYRMSSLGLKTPNSAAGERLGALTFAGFGPGRIGAPTFVSGVPELAPRLGLAYAINNKTVVRGGYGIYYAQGNENAITGTDVGAFITGFQFPQFLTSTNNGVTPASIFSQGFPAFTKPLPDLDPTLANGGSLDYFNQGGANSPTLQSWTFDVQRQFGLNALVDAAYVGQHGYELAGNLENLDQVNPKYLSLGATLEDSITSPAAIAAGISLPYPGFTGSVAQALRPFPQFTNVTDLGQPTGRSSYEGLQLKVQKRLSEGLNFLLSYTLSKTLGNNGAQPYAIFAPEPLNTYNQSLAKSLAPTDQTHNLVASYLYQLPLGPGKRFANKGGALAKIVGGWESSGILSYASGTPIAVTGGPPLPLFGGPNEPNLVPGVPVRTSVSPGNFNPATDRYLNIRAFVQPAPFSFGDVGPALPNVRGFPAYNEDISLIKDTYFTESKYLQFRVETFNTFNRVVFSNPASNANVLATFGQVTGQANSPRVIQFALKFFW